MLIHAAAVMALDVGLGKPFNLAKAKRGFGGPLAEQPPGPPSLLVDSDTIEARRAFLVCYYLCARWVKSLSGLMSSSLTLPVQRFTSPEKTQPFALDQIYGCVH